MTDPKTLVADLVDLLDVEEIDVDLYRGRRSTNGVGRVFGGQVIAQALQAAQRSVGDGDGLADDAKVAHSLHGYFMRPGAEDHPIVYRVARDFEGRSFATRRVVAMQRGQPILNLAASFQRPEPGYTHQDAMPIVPGPETLTSEAVLHQTDAERMPERLRAVILRPRPIELRLVEPRHWLHPEPSAPVQHAWFRAVAPLGDDPALHRAILAYASDMLLLGTAMLPHGLTWIAPEVQTASLDHALWLHEPARVDEWLLYATDSQWAGHGRGMNRGRIFAADGRLVASVAQEGLIRRRPRAPG